jgi:hypothetical protein
MPRVTAGEQAPGYESTLGWRNLNGMLERLQAMWRSWRVRRRQYQLDRALYKAGGHGSARDGGYDARPNQIPPSSSGP